MVDARPSALRDNTCHCATGLPSVIQDGSIGRGVKGRSSLVVSIRLRDIIGGLKRLNQKTACYSTRCGRINSGNFLSFRYGEAFNPREKMSQMTHRSLRLRGICTAIDTAWLTVY